MWYTESPEKISQMASSRMDITKFSLCLQDPDSHCLGPHFPVVLPLYFRLLGLSWPTQGAPSLPRIFPAAPPPPAHPIQSLRGVLEGVGEVGGGMQLGCVCDFCLMRYQVAVFSLVYLPRAFITRVHFILNRVLTLKKIFSLFSSSLP